MADPERPDAERLLRSFLVEHPAITALGLSRVSTEIAENAAFPYLRLFLSGDDGSYPFWLPILQVDCLTDIKAQAQKMGSVVESLLPELVGEHSAVGGNVRGADMKRGFGSRTNQDGTSQYSGDIRLLLVRA